MSPIICCHPFHLFSCLLYRYTYLYLFSCDSVVSETWVCSNMSRTRCCHGKIKTSIIILYNSTKYFMLFLHCILLYFRSNLYYIYIHTYIWYLKNHYVTFNHCTSLPHIIFCIRFFYVFEYFILLLCFITFIIDYCYALFHTPSHV